MTIGIEVTNRTRLLITKSSRLSSKGVTMDNHDATILIPLLLALLYLACCGLLGLLTGLIQRWEDENDDEQPF